MRVGQCERDLGHQGAFVPDEAGQKMVEAIRRFAAGKGGPVHRRILGLSGIGKTRLLLEAFKAGGIRERALYAAEPGDVPAELWAWLRDRTSTETVLVVDECTDAEAEKLETQADACDGRVRLVTIGIGEPFLAEVAPSHFFLERLGDEEIRKLLTAQFTTLPHDQIAWIIRLAAGYVKLAVVSAEAVALKPEIDIGS